MTNLKRTRNPGEYSLLARLRITAKNLKRKTDGNVAVMFALALLPTFLAVGAAVDITRALLVRDRLSQAMDAAALAVGGTPGLSESTRQALAEKYFAANYPSAEIGTPGQLMVNVNGDVVTMTATAQVTTTLMAILGQDTLTVSANTEVTKESKGLEVAMVLDNTGSMSGAKIAALKTAATDLVNILFGEETAPEKLKIGLVPFAAAVNIGTDVLGKTIMDEDGLSSIHGENFDETNGEVNIFDLYDQIPNRAWNGCVETRPMPYDTKDKKPDASDPDTLWVPFFSPDHPDTSSYYDNRYLSDGISGSYDQRQRYTGKYNGTSVSSSSKGPLRECTVPPLTPLTNQKQVLLDAINAMGASGYTHIPVGLAWGWRVLSPKKPFKEGVSYSDPDYTKAIILLTDGENTIDRESTHNLSNYSAYGFLSEGRLGTTNANAFEDKLDSNTTLLCNRIKNKGIRVYTITFQVNSNNVRDLMEDCATEPALYFNSPSTEELQNVFQAIATDLSNLRLSK